MTTEEWDALARAVALEVAHERIVGTDRTLPIKIETIRAAKDAELKRLGPSAIEAESIDGNLLAEEVKRLVGEIALLTMALFFAHRNDELLKDKPKPYTALHGLLTLSRTFRAALWARWTELLRHGPVLSAAERSRALEVIHTANLDGPG